MELTDADWIAHRAAFASLRLEPSDCAHPTHVGTLAGDNRRKRTYWRSWALDIPLDAWKEFHSSPERAGAYAINPMYDLLPDGHWARDPEGLAPVDTTD